MTRDEIICMAREAGYGDAMSDLHAPALKRFAALVAAAEREKFAIDSTHTCHAECQRPVCVAIREAVAAEREACAKVAAWILKMPENDVSFAIRERGVP